MGNIDWGSLLISLAIGYLLLPLVLAFLTRRRSVAAAA